MKTRYINQCAALLLCLPTLLFARDLPKTDPDRAAILDSARGQEAVKFIVKDLVRDGNYAFLCALETEANGGGIIGTDEALNVHQWGFVRLSEGWFAYSLPSGFAESSAKVDCKATVSAGASDVVQNASDIQNALRDALESNIRRNLDFGIPDKNDLKLLHELVVQHVVTDVDIEHDKDYLLVDRSMLEVDNGQCKTAACRAENGKAFDVLQLKQRDKNISSLAWGHCQYGRRVSSLPAIARCVDAVASKPFCRPGMKLLKDAKDIDHCIQATHEHCLQTFTNPKDQPWVCGQ